jgi:hypothetical protein
MRQNEIRNYAVVKTFDVLRELGKIEGRIEFSKYYFGRNADYFSMIMRNRRQFSLGSLHRLIKRLGYEIENEANNGAKKKLTECVVSLQGEILIRLDRQASIRSSERTDASRAI